MAAATTSSPKTSPQRPNGWLLVTISDGAFVAGGDELEEQVRGFWFEGDVADLVDDEQRVAAEPDQLGLQPAGVVGVGEAGDPFGGGGEQDAVAGLAGADAEPDGQVGLAGAGSDGDRLQHLRSVLPCEVRVTALTHPLFGSVLEASGFKRWNGVLLLVVGLPDGSPGTIRADATDVFATPPVEASPLVLDGDGMRRLHGLVDGACSGTRRSRRRRRQIGSTCPLFAPTIREGEPICAP